MAQSGVQAEEVGLLHWLSQAPGLHVPQRLRAAPGRLLRRVPARVRLAGIAIAGALAAALVGYLSSSSANAEPPHFAVIGRVVVITTLIAAGVYAQTSRVQQRMGRLLVGAGFFSCLWALTGSSNRLAFSVGVLTLGGAAPVFYYLLLAHPSGRLQSRLERVFLGVASAAMLSCWLAAVLTTTQPPIAAPLLRCAPHCPPNALYLGFHSGAIAALRAIVVTCWFVLTCGMLALLLRRLRSANAALRRAMFPTALAAMFAALFVLGTVEVRSTGNQLVSTLGYLYVGIAIVIPLAILLGLSLERLCMGHALATFINRLADTKAADLGDLLADTMHDPSLKIVYRRPAHGTYLDPSGALAPAPQPSRGRAVTEIIRDGRPVASVLYDAELADQDQFVRAAAGAAMIWFENGQLEADLKASVAELAASRRRLVDAADAERRRIERDLHDGAQQHLVAIRVKLDLALAVLHEDRERGECLLADVGEEMECALEDLRSLAQGIYPPLLAEYGLGEALGSASRRCPMAVTVNASGLRRYSMDTEAAVYFCCLEALQNVAKHAGRDATAALHIWEDDSRLRFQASDTGVGFEPRTTRSGSGLINMRDRVAAVGGYLKVSSHEGGGTLVAGNVPLAPANVEPLGPTASARKRTHPLTPGGTQPGGTQERPRHEIAPSARP
jgi:signal transduction histidine kinase